MANHSVTHPVVMSFTTTIGLFIPSYIDITAYRSINEWEKYFSELMENAETPSDKEYFNVLRIVLKWAADCGATLIKVSYQDTSNHTLGFTFAFNDINKMKEFCIFLNVNTVGEIKPENYLLEYY